MHVQVKLKAKWKTNTEKFSLHHTSINVQIHNTNDSQLTTPTNKYNYANKTNNIHYTTFSIAFHTLTNSSEKI